MIFITQADMALYGIDWNGPISDSEEDHVTVVETRNPIEERDFLRLQAVISPVSNSDCHGVDLFIQTLQFVHQILS